MKPTRDGLVEFLRDSQGIDPSEFHSDDTELFSSGLLDSFTIVELIQFLESQGGFTIEPSEVNLDNLDTVGRILSFADAKSNA